MRVVRLALRTLAREWRSGELGVLLLALTVAVAALTGVGFLVERIGAAVALQAGGVLAADLRIGSPQPLAPAYFEEAARRGLASGRSARLLSVVFRGESSQLTNVVTVTAGYPLRGRLLTAAEAFAPGQPAGGVPPRGEAWPDSRLLAALGGAVGDTLSIGSATLRVGRVLISRPDQGGTFSELAPTLIMNDADLPATGLVQPGSRVSYAGLYAGPRPAIDGFKAWLGAHKLPAERLRDIRDASPQLRNALDRAGRFLGLAALVSVLLCAIAVALSARRYVHRHLDTVALMKTVGATRAFTLSLAAMQLLVLALAAALIGAGLGYATQAWLLHAVRGLLAVSDVPPPTMAPVAIGVVTAVALLAGFALPPLVQLARVPALRVLRRDVGPPPLIALLAFGPAVAVVLLLIAWVVPEPRLYAWCAAGLGTLVAVLALAGGLLVGLAARLRGRVGVAWRYGIANLSRRRAETIVQLVAFGVGIMVLLLLSILRSGLENDWRRALPARLPNYFFINIPPESRTQFQQFLAARDVHLTRMLPMIRGRLTAINGRAVESLRDGRAEEGFATREQNLTWTAELGDDNRVVAGRWWAPGDAGRPLVSVSTEFADSLRLHLGDRLTFDIAGETRDVTVASVRKVQWDSFQPNFFIVFAPGVLDGLAGTWMTSAWLSPAAARGLAALAREFPSVSIFDIDDLLGQVRGVIDKAALAVRSVFLFTLLAGLTVLLAAVQSSRDERRYESALLRTLGASRGTVWRGVLAEFATLGGLAGLVAAAGAIAAAQALARGWLELHLAPGLLPVIEGAAGGALLVSAGGWLATRRVIAQPPLGALRA